MKDTSDTSPAYWAPFLNASEFQELPEMVKGSGVFLFDSAGRKYLDGISGSYNHSLGHTHGGLVNVIKDQLETLVHACNMNSNTKLPNELSEKLRDKLSHLGLKHTFLVSSGSEGVEASIKMAWFYQSNNGHKNRTKIISINGAYHGCTLGAMIATQRSYILDGIPRPSTEYSIVMPKPSGEKDVELWEEVLELNTDEIAAVIVEPVMGMEGSYELPSGFLKKLSMLLKKHDVLLICDEVYCGIGRTGYFCASDTQGAQPDIVLFSKGLGGGFPITAIVSTGEVWESFKKASIPFFRHGHTQSGNLIGCRAALYLLEYLDQHEIYQQVKEKGNLLLRLLHLALDNVEGIESIQGKGLMISISFYSPESCRNVQLAARTNGLILGSAYKHLKISPSLLITNSEIEELVYKITGAVKHLNMYSQN